MAVNGTRTGPALSQMRHAHTPPDTSRLCHHYYSSPEIGQLLLSLSLSVCLLTISSSASDTTSFVHALENRHAILCPNYPHLHLRAKPSPSVYKKSFLYSISHRCIGFYTSSRTSVNSIAPVLLLETLNNCFR